MARRGVSAVVSVCVLVCASPAMAGPVGPDYPPPGGVTLSSASTEEAAPGRAGGQTWTYEGFDFSAFEEMWWGAWDGSPPKLAFDGDAEEPGEILTFSAADSDAPNGKAVWIGTADVPLMSGGVETLPTRLVITTKTLDGEVVAMIDPAAVGVAPGAGLVAPVEGAYRASFIFEAFRSGSWQPAVDLYDGMPTAADGEVVTSFGAGFYYNPVCGDGQAEGDEECDDGAANGTLDSCCSASCTFEPSGAACDDGDLCTGSDLCDGAGTCTGNDPVLCEASDQCHDAGTCDPATGVCSDPAKADGSACDDEDACTLGDTCQTGSCQSGGQTLLDPVADVDQTVQCVIETLPAP